MSSADNDRTGEKRFFHVKHEDWVKMLASIFFGVAATLTIQWLTSKSPALATAMIGPTTFTGENNKVGIMTFVVENIGAKEAEDVQCSLALDEPEILEVIVSPETHKSQTEISKNKHRFTTTLPRLNPTESVAVSIMANRPDKLPSDPDVKVSGKGVVSGKLQKTQLRRVVELGIMTQFLATLGFTYMLILLTRAMWGLWITSPSPRTVLSVVGQVLNPFSQITGLPRSSSSEKQDNLPPTS